MSERLLRGVEQLIDEIVFDADVARRHVPQEAISERSVAMEVPNHFAALNQEQAAGSGRMRWPPGETALPKELAGLHHRDDRPLPRVRQDGELHGNRYDIDNARRRIALAEDRHPSRVIDVLHSHAGHWIGPWKFRDAALLVMVIVVRSGRLLAGDVLNRREKRPGHRRLLQDGDEEPLRDAGIEL